MGDMVHQALEKLYTDVGYHKLLSKEELLAFYDRIWDKEWSDDIHIAKKEYNGHNYRKRGEKFLSDYYDQYHPFDDMRILGLETEDRMTLPDGSMYSVRIDKLGCSGDVYYVCDYKTNASLKDQMSADTDRQLAMYSIWVHDRFPDARRVVLKWYMLAFGKEVVSERSKEQLKALQAQTVALIKEIETCVEYPTTVSKLCHYCEYQKICPSFSHRIELEAKPFKEFKEDDGLKLVNEFAELKLKKAEIEDRMEVIEKELVLFAQSKGIDVVYGANKKITVKEVDKIQVIDQEGLIAHLKKIGVYDEYIQLAGLKLHSAIRKGSLNADDYVKKEIEYKISMSKRE